MFEAPSLGPGGGGVKFKVQASFGVFFGGEGEFVMRF